MNSTISFIISVVVIILAAVFVLLLEKKTKWEGHDERQILISLKSSTISFYTLLFLCLIDFMAIRTFELPFKPELLIVFSIFISYTIFIVREIWFNNMQSNVLSGKIIFGSVTVILALIVFKLVKSFVSGTGTLESLLVACSLGACYLICTAAIVIRKIISKKNAGDDE